MKLSGSSRHNVYQGAYQTYSTKDAINYSCSARDSVYLARWHIDQDNREIKYWRRIPS